MAPMIAHALPTMQLVCNLVMPGVPESNFANQTQLSLSNQAGTEDDSVVEAFKADREQFLEGSTSRRDPGKLPEGYVDIQKIGMAYKVYEDHVPWLVALKRCHKEGAGLAVIDLREKQDAFYSHFEFDNVQYYHIGIIRLDGKWVNANTGSPVSTDIPWIEGFPMNDPDCATYIPYNKGLFNEDCSPKRRYICERPLLGN